MDVNHKLIPQRNINLRFNLSDTPHYINLNGKDCLLEDVFFWGLQDRFMNAHMKLSGKVHLLGVCFLPEGFYPFFNTPVSEYKNQLLGAKEAGFKHAVSISEQIKEIKDTSLRIAFVEMEFLKLLASGKETPAGFSKIFNKVKQTDNPMQLSAFCKHNNIGIRTLERMFNKYIGLAPITYGSLNRFQNSLNQILYNDFTKLSDLAYNNGYFDQTHFIKQFKRYTGNSPKVFVKQKKSILQIGKLR